MSARLRDVSYEFAGSVQPRKLMQQVANIDFIPRQVTAYGVSINRESHVRTLLSIATYNRSMERYRLHLFL